MKSTALPLIAATWLGMTSICAVAAEPSYLQLKEAVEAGRKGLAKVLALEIETASPIPINGKAGAFGYGALTDGPNNVLVLSTHLPINDSKYEQAPSGFHTHVLNLKAPTPNCAGASFEVDLPSSTKNTGFDANYPWSIKGSKIKVEKIPTADLGDAGVENIVSFTIKPILDIQQQPTHLCVTIVDKI